MKKITIALISILMVLTLCSCSKNENNNKPNIPVEPKPDPVLEVEKDVEVSLLIEQLLGIWACPNQYDNFYATFTKDEDGMYYLGEESNESGVIARIDSVSYNSETKLYRLSLTGNEEPLEYDSLIVDIANIQDGFIKIQNPYENMELCEYISVKEYSDPSANMGTTRVYQYEDIDLNPLYYPTLLLNEDMTFIFTENMYAGMLDIVGEYEIIDGDVVLTIQNQEDLQGFSCEGLQIIVLETHDEDTLILKTDVCYSRTDAIFSFIEMR